MDKYQYMIEIVPTGTVQPYQGEMHLVDANSDDEAKSKLEIFLNFTIPQDEMVIFDKCKIEGE